MELTQLQNMSQLTTALTQKNTETTANDARSQDRKRLEKACQDFESIFLHQMYASMKKTLTGDALFGKNLQRDIMESMHDQYLTDGLARDGVSGLGFGKLLYHQLQASIEK